MKIAIITLLCIAALIIGIRINSGDNVDLEAEHKELPNTKEFVDEQTLSKLGETIAYGSTSDEIIQIGEFISVDDVINNSSSTSVKYIGEELPVLDFNNSLAQNDGNNDIQEIGAFIDIDDYLSRKTSSSKIIEKGEYYRVEDYLNAVEQGIEIEQIGENKPVIIDQ